MSKKIIGELENQIVRKQAEIEFNERQIKSLMDNIHDLSQKNHEWHMAISEYEVALRVLKACEDLDVAL